MGSVGRKIQKKLRSAERLAYAQAWPERRRQEEDERLEKESRARQEEDARWWRAQEERLALLFTKETFARTHGPRMAEIKGEWDANGSPIPAPVDHWLYATREPAGMIRKPISRLALPHVLVLAILAAEEGGKVR